MVHERELKEMVEIASEREDCVITKEIISKSGNEIRLRIETEERGTELRLNPEEPEVKALLNVVVQRLDEKIADYDTKAAGLGLVFGRERLN